MKLHSSPAKLCQLITDHFLTAFKHVASITERLLRTDCCWPGYFLQGFLGHPLQHALWLSLAPLFAELSQNLRENILIRRPQPSAVSWSLAFGSLAAAFGFFLWDFRSNIEQYSTWQYQWQVQGCASGPWYLALAKPHLWKLGCYLLRENNTKQRTEPQPNILQHLLLGSREVARDKLYTRMIHNIQLPRNFRE